MLQWPTFFSPTEMLPVERVVVDWERGAILAPLYSLASLYKYAEACPASPSQSCLNKIGAAHHWPSSVWIWRKTINPLMSYIKPQITPPSSLIFAILNGRSKRWVGGDAWVRFGLAHFLQRLIVFWWFLQTYMTSGPCSSWFFLVMKSWFFWYYLGLQVMAILCRTTKNSLRGTATQNHKKMCESILLLTLEALTSRCYQYWQHRLFGATVVIVCADMCSARTSRRYQFAAPTIPNCEGTVNFLFW